MKLDKRSHLSQNEAMTRRIILIFLLTAFLTAACSVHAYVPAPERTYDFQNSKTRVPRLMSDRIICRNDPINRFDPDGRRDYEMFGLYDIFPDVEMDPSEMGMGGTGTGGGYYAAGKRANSGSRSKHQVRINYEKGQAFEQTVKSQKLKTQENVVEQITVKTKSGTKTRIDLVGTDKVTGKIKLTEAKSSSKASLTKKQKIAFPEIAQSGAVVVGQGKAPFVGGTSIPPTGVNIVRPFTEASLKQ